MNATLPPLRREIRKCIARGLGTALIGAALLSIGAGQAAAQDAAQSDFTYWFWGEGDVPGMDKWMAGMVADYTKLHPNVHINIVSQSNDTLIGSFRLAAQSRTGPEMATQ